MIRIVKTASGGSALKLSRADWLRIGYEQGWVVLSHAEWKGGVVKTASGDPFAYVRMLLKDPQNGIWANMMKIKDSGPCRQINGDPSCWQLLKRLISTMHATLGFLRLNDDQSMNKPVLSPNDALNFLQQWKQTLDQFLTTVKSKTGQDLNSMPEVQAIRGDLPDVEQQLKLMGSMQQPQKPQTQQYPAQGAQPAATSAQPGMASMPAAAREAI
jgi:hypothetical protein